MAENQHFHVELKDLAPHLSKLLNHEVNCHIRNGGSMGTHMVKEAHMITKSQVTMKAIKESHGITRPM